MITRFLALGAVVTLCTLPGQSQNALDSTAATGEGLNSFGQSSFRTTETNQDYRQLAAPGNVPLAPQGLSDFTNTQGVGSPNGPDLPGAPGFGGSGGSGAASSAPFAGNFTAPGNFALRQIGRRTLPPTRLESFVRNSGMNDRIYGDEGTEDVPPYNDFSVLDSGVNMPELHTGHKSDAPSAWGFPQ